MGAKNGSRRGASELVGIVVILLILVTVSAAVLLSGFVTVLTNRLTHGGNSTLVAVSGTLAVPGSTGDGNLVLSINTYESSPIVEVKVTNSPANPMGFAVLANGSKFVPGTTFPLPLPNGTLSSDRSTSAYFLVVGASAGVSYSFVLNCTLAKGGSEVQVLTVNARV